MLSILFAMTVMVDPGHGGVDDGAVRQGHKESEITLNVGKKLYDVQRDLGFLYLVRIGRTDV